jgi:putative redox protein
MTLRMYAQRKNLPVEHIKVELTHTRNYQDDCDNCEQQTGMEAIVRNISFVGDLDEQQKMRFLEIADKCPVHKTLHSNVTVISKLVD